MRYFLLKMCFNVDLFCIYQEEMKVSYKRIAIKKRCFKCCYELVEAFWYCSGHWQEELVILVALLM